MHFQHLKQINQSEHLFKLNNYSQEYTCQT